MNNHLRILLCAEVERSCCSMDDSVNASDAAGEGEEVLCFRQRVEKSTGGEMIMMQWSPTMDLLAAAFADNSVSQTKAMVGNIGQSDLHHVFQIWKRGKCCFS